MLSGLPEIVLHLLIHPAFSRRIKSDGQPDGHFRTDSLLPVEEACKSVSADAECFGCFSDVQTQWFQAKLPQHFAGMWWIMHTHIF